MRFHRVRFFRPAHLRRYLLSRERVTGKAGVTCIVAYGYIELKCRHCQRNEGQGMSKSITLSGVLPAAGFQRLLDAVRDAGFRTIGPRARNGAIVLDELSDVAELPVGWNDEQVAGSYRAAKGSGDRLFDYVVGPTSWKRFLYPPRRELWHAQKEGQAWVPEAPTDDFEPTAFLGVRNCDIAAIRTLDRVLLDSGYREPVYDSRRSKIFIIAVSCAAPVSTCFCTSMGGGPTPTDGFDLSLVELGSGNDHRFIISSGSERGAEIVSALNLDEVVERDLDAAATQDRTSVEKINQVPAMANARSTIAATMRSDHWDEVADRCLSCANCTLVCPTCFCVDIEDTTDLSGTSVSRHQQWDSCFTMSHSYLHGGSIRKTTAARYRQWLSHKLGTWHDQFGSSGCVGCGRCVTWCPAAIDIRVELEALEDSLKEMTTEEA